MSLFRPTPIQGVCDRRCYGCSDPQPGIEHLKLPIERVIVTQTADEYETCLTAEACRRRVKAIFDANSRLKDIPFNFLIGGDGIVYEGRGFLFQGESFSDGDEDSSSLNELGISVAFIGNFSIQEPSVVQLQTFQVFLEQSERQDWIDEDYLILLQDQLENKESTMNGLLEAMQSFERFHSRKKLLFA